MSELTTASAWIAGLAIVSMIAAGWRKPARATAAFTRAGRRSPGLVPVVLAETAPSLHQRTPIWRKLWAVVASSTLAVIVGAVIAIVVSATIGFAIITLTDMLRR